jgi:ketosteroid isomerase-like protein
VAHPNEDLVRKGYEAFASGDVDWLNEHFADDIAWHTSGRNPLAGDHMGKQAVFDLFAKTMEVTGGTFRLELHDVLANDEHGVALVVASGERNGRRLEDRQVHVLHLEGEKVTEFWGHPGDQYRLDEFLS